MLKPNMRGIMKDEEGKMVRKVGKDRIPAFQPYQKGDEKSDESMDKSAISNQQALDMMEIEEDKELKEGKESKEEEVEEKKVLDDKSALDGKELEKDKEMVDDKQVQIEEKNVKVKEKASGNRDAALSRLSRLLGINVGAKSRLLSPTNSLIPEDVTDGAEGKEAKDALKEKNADSILARQLSQFEILDTLAGAFDTSRDNDLIEGMGQYFDKDTVEKLTQLDEKTIFYAFKDLLTREECTALAARIGKMKKYLGSSRVVLIKDRA